MVSKRNLLFRGIIIFRFHLKFQGNRINHIGSIQTSGLLLSTKESKWRDAKPQSLIGGETDPKNLHFEFQIDFPSPFTSMLYSIYSLDFLWLFISLIILDPPTLFLVNDFLVARWRKRKRERVVGWQTLFTFGWRWPEQTAGEKGFCCCLVFSCFGVSKSELQHAYIQILTIPVPTRKVLPSISVLTVGGSEIRPITSWGW